MKLPKIAQRLSLFAFLACALVVTGCGSDGTPVAPGIQPEIINSTDNFQFQVTSVSNFSGTLEYPWSITGTVADINQSSTVTAGNIVLALLDDTGATVYSNDLAQNGTFVTTAGATGTWRIRVVFANGSGTLNFRADKRL
ncbi:MAG: hypothetical protein ACE5EO_08065 [Candidatus Krumholzibacteriia bacterium]